MLCRSSRKPSAFTQWPPGCVPTSDENFSETPKVDGFMSVVNSIFACVFHPGLLYNSVSKKTIESLDTTQLRSNMETCSGSPQTSRVSTACEGSSMCPLVHSPQVHAADATGLLATVRGDHSKKLTHCSMMLKKKHGCISSHGDTQRNEKPLLNSATS